MGRASEGTLYCAGNMLDIVPKTYLWLFSYAKAYKAGPH